MPTTPDELKSANETARLIGLNPESLRRMVREGRVPAYMVGRALRFSIAEVKDACRVGSSGNDGKTSTSTAPDFDAV